MRNDDVDQGTWYANGLDAVPEHREKWDGSHLV